MNGVEITEFTTNLVRQMPILITHAAVSFSPTSVGCYAKSTLKSNVVGRRWTLAIFCEIPLSFISASTYSSNNFFNYYYCDKLI